MIYNNQPKHFAADLALLDILLMNRLASFSCVSSCFRAFETRDQKKRLACQHAEVTRSAFRDAGLVKPAKTSAEERINLSLGSKSENTLNVHTLLTKWQTHTPGASVFYFDSLWRKELWTNEAVAHHRVMLNTIKAIWVDDGTRL